MYEVEVKVRADHADVLERLDERETDHLGTVTQVDTYYDAPHRDFAETDEALRVRRERPGTGDGTAVEDRVEITYKGPLLEAESKSREEHETAVADPDATERILESLGFEPAATVEKERDRFAVDGYTLTLDSVDGLGEFVEVETETPDGDIADARDGARSLLSSLGFDPAGQIRTSYLGLLLDSNDRDSDDDSATVDDGPRGDSHQ